MPQLKLGNIRVIFPNFQNLSLKHDVSRVLKIKMGERFAVVSEEEINLLVDKAVPENTKKSTSYAVNVFDGKLLVNVSFKYLHK